MSKKDKKQWLKLFYERLGYYPLSKIRNLPEYSGKTDLSETFEIASDTDAPYLINIIFPFDKRPPFALKTSDGVAVFPQKIKYDDRTLYEIDEPILYDGTFYALDDFISMCPDLELGNAECMFGHYTFSLSYFLLETKELNEFKKIFLTPIKSKIHETNFYPDRRGAFKNVENIVRFRKKTVVKIYNEIVNKTGRKKPLPIHEVWERWGNLCQKLNFDEKYQASYATIRRDLKEYLNQ